ncbi:MAG: hypothetical protein HKN87_00915 [Saprospiraceae bacterium]|nr:hypothetical protein [Saprospiraceae bacterium]
MSINLNWWMLLLLMSGLSQKGQTQENSHPIHSSIFRQHYDRIANDLVDKYGKEATPMWLSSWNLDTQTYPFDFSRPDSIPCRVYLNRFIDAPAGATLYWSLPDISACIDLSSRIGRGNYRLSAKKYVEAYLERCTNKDGIILWGNHYYYHVLMDTAVKFGSSDHPRAFDLARESGHLHEMRPILPPWEVLHAWFPKRIERHITEVVQRHVVDTTGEFNRHANGLSEYAFIEAGSILVHALSFLYSKTEERRWLALADKIINYSVSHRNPDTGLVPNSPSKDRWDKYASTTEIGLWASNIIKSTAYVPPEVKDRWIEIASQALRPWLKYGYDKEIRQYFGGLSVEDAKPIPKEDDYPYKPDKYTDIWHPLFPRHDYPMQFAECCLDMFELTADRIFEKAVHRWFATIQSQWNERHNRIQYAENNGRIIHFLRRYASLYKVAEAKELADELTHETIKHLFVPNRGMLRSHTGEYRYDCVDGIGLLYLGIFENKWSVEQRRNAYF